MMDGNKRGGRALRMAIGMAALVLLLAGGAGAATLTVNASDGADYERIHDAIDIASTGDSWSVIQIGNILEIGYGSGTNFPQYAALNISSGYFRMVAPETTWGTSIILLPSFWENGVYKQGPPVTYTSYVEGSDLILLLNGTISNLTSNVSMRIFPPSDNTISANVEVNVTGNAQLDDRPGEAFKPVMLSSMHISSDQWDASSAYADSTTFDIPSEGWIVLPPVNSSVFGLKGGDSKWKTNAPTVEIRLDKNHEVTGWVTKSNNPNDDNVGFWAATNEILSTWNYTIVVRKEPQRTLTVDDSGGANYTRIQDAIDNASAGDTILVHCGTYYENVDVNKHLIMRGIDNGAGKHVVDANGSGSAITLCAGNIMLEGIKAVNSGIPKAGINVSSSYNVIKNNTADLNPYVGYLDYDLKNNSGKENQTVIVIDGRTIREHTLKYTTSGEPKILNVVEKAFDGNFSAAKSAGLEEFDAGKMSPTAGAYISMDWLGEKYVGIKNKPNKLAKLVIEQGSESSEYKTLMIGETWDIGGGWTLSAQAIDAKSTPRQAWVVLTKDGRKKDDKVIAEKKVYTYVEKSIGGESDVPLFVTYVDSIFLGALSDMVTLRYTWAIDTNITFIELPPPSSLTILINNGKAYTNSPSVNLSLSAIYAEEMSFSNDGTAWSTWETFVLTKEWTLAAGDGTKTVYFKARSVSGESAPVSDTIILDTTPPASVTNLRNISYAPNYINWTWTDPADSDFSKVMIYLDGTFQTNVSKGVQFYNATGFAPDTEHIIATRTVDTSGNVNQTWFNHTTRTALISPMIFDTGMGSYPSIMGTHNGTLRLNQSINVSKMYTYPSPGTGGHSEYVKIYNNSWSIEANWSGYTGDWRNITLSQQPFTLESGEYNYTIKTGSYPQIIHKQNHTTPDGSIITSSEFIDANGRRYTGWIPAIRLE